MTLHPALLASKATLPGVTGLLKEVKVLLFLTTGGWPSARGLARPENMPLECDPKHQGKGRGSVKSCTAGLTTAQEAAPGAGTGLCRRPHPHQTALTATLSGEGVQCGWYTARPDSLRFPGANTSVWLWPLSYFHSLQFILDTSAFGK